MYNLSLFENFLTNKQTTTLNLEDHTTEGDPKLHPLNSQDSFILTVISLYEQEKFIDLRKTYSNEYCKKPKSKHCKQSNTCVQGYNHYSVFFGFVISQSNHFFYLVFLIQQFLLVGMFLYLVQKSFEYEYKSLGIHCRQS
eukprot:TRINITY_DN2450_c0_g1_i7.p1 TRINITY_DN2450_c0_g1~~TRINITY_DN2450_c0_g1_i7.p1  ORF type:complete len:140 (-),score=24.98 TRINITY_DN2450_c0_g1_i7:307-726(-)